MIPNTAPFAWPDKVTSSKLVLTKSVYGLETDATKTPFGLLNGQIRSDSVVNNAGWFNLAGEKVGHGDLSMKDLMKISNGINSNECLFILSEFDATWNLPKDVNANEPGKDYVLKHCFWGISKGSLLKISDASPPIKTITVYQNSAKDAHIENKPTSTYQFTKLSRVSFIKVINTLFFAPKQTTAKHTLSPDIKTEGMDAAIQSTLKQVQGFMAGQQAPQAPQALQAYPTTTGVSGPTGSTGTSTTGPTGTLPKVPLPAAPPIKVKRITP